MSEFSKKIDPRKLIVPGAFSLAVIGLAFFCNINKVKSRLTPGARRVLDSMSADSDAFVQIDALPDSYADHLATGINKILNKKVNSNGVPIRSGGDCMEKKGKPHHLVEDVIEHVYSAFQSHEI